MKYLRLLGCDTKVNSMNGNISMWKYECVTRQEFEKIKDKVEKNIVMLGGKEVPISLSYIQRANLYSDDVIDKSHIRSAFEYNDNFYRVDEVLFSDKPFIVIECGTYDELIKNIMEDATPFPYDLTEDELLNEVKYSLGIEPYPKE